MSKKIIILNGSPRPNGNTAALIQSFTDGATATGHTVTRFDLQKMEEHLRQGAAGSRDLIRPMTW